MAGTSNPRVFISYSHDSPEHMARVLDFAQTLRPHGAVVEIDRYHTESIVNWPDWCREQMDREQSDFVICVCTAEYRARIKGKVPPALGKGVYWEGALLQSELYDQKGNRRFIPVLFDDEPDSSIVEVLRGWTFCRIRRFALEDDGYESLLRILSLQPRVIPATVGTMPLLPADTPAAPPPVALTVSVAAAVVEITDLPLATPDFLGRIAELEALDAAWTDAAGTEALVLVAPGGTGKSSLVRRWLEGMKRRRWDGAARVFGWSFYSQGTAEDRQASEEPFFAAALAFFGVTVAATASIWDKAAALARAVRAQRTLLILDGLEPLQYPPGPMAGELKAPGVQALLKALVHNGQPGLCVITTREAVGELAGHLHNRDHPHGSVRQIDLGNLSVADGAKLLHRIGVQTAGAAGISDDDAELLKASEAAQGHALTLRILGLYLARAHHGDVRRAGDVALAAADPGFRFDTDSPYGHAFKAMRAYERWLDERPVRSLRERLLGFFNGCNAADQRRNRLHQRQLAVLRLLGLFDRPATPDCLRALLQAPVIDGLTEALSGITEAEWNALLADLRTAGLVQTAKWQPVAVVGYGEELARAALAAYAKNNAYPLGPPQAFTPPGPPLPADAETLDAHPLLREYFARRLADSAPEAARAGHARLYEHLSASVPYWPEGEAGLAPLYQAVAHGCRAGRYEEARAEVYEDRINRRGEFYATKKLGLYGTELSAVAHFFREPWRTPVAAPALSDSDRAWLLAVAAYDLRALGRLTEAVEPMQATVEMTVAEQDWKNAARAASNLSELQQTLGALRAAIVAGEAAVRHADDSGDAFMRLYVRTTLADARQQAGETAAALSGFAEAEALQGQGQPEYPRLYSVQGFRYCDALLQSAERTAWATGTGAAVEQAQRLERLAELQAVEARAAQTLAWAQAYLGPLDIGLDHLTLARVSLCRSRLLAASDPKEAAAVLQAATHAAGQAVEKLREAGQDEFIVRGLLTRACVHSRNADADAARADLDEAQRIAERGGMKLHLADVHLHRARLFDDRASLAAARQLIDEIGYERRRDELDDAQGRLDGRAVVLPEFASVLAQAWGENLPEPPDTP